ncbi:MAG: homocysteine S-methyltransferase family protein [Pseudomonadota bacterium]
MNIATRLTNTDVIIIDGAMGTELQRRDVPMNFEVWSAAALFSHPNVIRDIHSDYIRAGAEVQIAATYNTAPHVINPSSFETSSREFTAAAFGLLRESIENTEPEHPVWIAGSISTTVESRRKEMLDVSTLRDSYTEHAENLAEQGCDLIMLEMMLTHEFAIDLEFQAEIAAIAKRTGLPVWAGIALKMSESGELHLQDGAENTGEALRSGIEALLAEGVDVAGIMHSEVETTLPALDLLEQYWSGPVAVYPNSGHYKRPHWFFDSIITPENFASDAAQWAHRGVKAIGGCCGIGPEHIMELSRALGREV